MKFTSGTMRRIGPPSVASFNALLTNDSRMSPLLIWVRPSSEINGPVMVIFLSRCGETSDAAARI
jgi:hypothetical protein